MAVRTGVIWGIQVSIEDELVKQWSWLAYETVLGGYTSYDYGAVITEERLVTREKYSEAKLEANFLMASPAYLTATPGNATNGTYTDTAAITTTPLFGDTTNFFVVR